MRGEPALLAQLRERVAAARGLQQVGAQQRVVDEARRHQPERLGVVHDHRRSPQARGHLLGALAVADEHLGRDAAGAPTARLGVVPSPPAGESNREAPAALARTGTLGHLGLAHGDAQLARRPIRRAMSATVPRARAPRAATSVGPAGTRELRLAERLLQAAQRVAQLVLAEDLAQARAVGLARGLRGGVEVERDAAIDGGQLLGDARVLGVRRSGSVCAWRR